jgi:hypothetical protein
MEEEQKTDDNLTEQLTKQPPKYEETKKRALQFMSTSKV